MDHRISCSGKLVRGRNIENPAAEARKVERSRPENNGAIEFRTSLKGASS